MITIKDVSKTYESGTHALHHISLHISRGEFGRPGPRRGGIFLPDKSAPPIPEGRFAAILYK